MQPCFQLVSANRWRLLGVLWLTLFVALSHAAAAAPQVAVSATPSDGSYGVVEISLLGASGKAHPCRAQLGDAIEVLFKNPDLWLAALKKRHPLDFPDDKNGPELLEDSLTRFVLVLAGQPLRTVPQLSFWEGPTREEQAREVEAARAAGRPPVLEPTPDEPHANTPKITPAPSAAPDAKPAPTPAPGVASQWVSFRFRLTRDPRNAESKADWDPLLRQSGIQVPMELTLGLLNEDKTKVFAAPSEIRVRPSKEQPLNEQRQFSFRRIPANTWTLSGGLVLLAAFGFFLYLIFRTSIVRDSALPIRPDGLPPASLGRCQMAFWFFLVSSAFFFLWLVTGRGDLDTINQETLALLTLSTVTALGAAFIPCKNPQPPSILPINYRSELEAAEKMLTALKADPNHRKPMEAALHQAEIRQARQRVKESSEALDRYRRLHRHQFLIDLLSEQGNEVSFHRFQIVVWTLLLGVIFISEVLTKLAMPAFSSTLLLLMGVSSGTYLAFKLPGTKQSEK